MGDFVGIFGLLGALIEAAGVPDAGPGPLGYGGGYTMQRRACDGPP